MKNKKKITLLPRINLAKKLADHLVGKNHKQGHRYLFGVLIMFVGVSISKYSAETEYFLLHIGGDALGYLIHGIGAIPFVEGFISE